MSIEELQQQISALKSAYDNVAGFSYQAADRNEHEEALKLLRLASYAAVRSYVNNNYTPASLEVKQATDGCGPKTGSAPWQIH